MVPLSVILIFIQEADVVVGITGMDLSLIIRNMQAHERSSQDNKILSTARDRSCFMCRRVSCI